MAKIGGNALKFAKLLGKGATSVARFAEVAVDGARAATKFAMRVSQISNKWMELQDISFKTARSMALSRQEAMKMDRQLMQEIKELGRAYGTSAEQIAEYQKNYSQSTGRNVQLTKMQIEQMVALGNITDNATADKLVEQFDTLGVSVEDTLAYTGQLQERAKFLGLNAIKASKTMAENIELAASYSFKNGVDDIQKMVLKSQSLKMNMNAVMSAVDKFSDIQGAIETSANIQMLGGSFAQQFSNPMGALYESMADPNAFMDRMLKVVEGKSRYDTKTNQVTFDPVTMAQLRQMSKELGIDVKELTRPAMIKAQDEAVSKEIRGSWSKEQMDAIKALSRTNFDEKTGKHFLKLLDENGEEKKVNVEDLTAEQLKQAQDSNLTQEKLWADVHTIKEQMLKNATGRARQNRSSLENLKGYGESMKGGIAQLENLFMPTISGILNGANGFFGNIAAKLGDFPLFGPNSFYSGSIIGPDMGVNHFAQGGIVKPVHAEQGAVVPGDQYYGDNVPVYANSGEMVINKQQQSGLMSLLSNIGSVGLSVLGGNYFGKKLGLGNIGTRGMLMSGLMGGDMLTSMLQVGAAKKFGMMGGMMAGMDPLSAMLFCGNLKSLPKGITQINKNKPEQNAQQSSSIWDFLDIFDAKKDKNGRYRNSKGKFTKSPLKQIFAKTSNIFNKLNFSLSKLTGRFGKLGARVSGLGGKFATFGKNFGSLAISKGKSLGSAALAKISTYKDSALNFGKVAKFKGLRNLVKLKNIGASVGEIGGSLKGFTSSLKGLGGISKGLGGAGKLLSGVGKRIPVLGTLLTAGAAIGGIAEASSSFDQKESVIKNSNLSESEKQEALDNARDEKRGEQGKAVGSAIGSSIGMWAGGALGSALGPIGTALGAAAGGFIGDKLGGAIGSLAKPISKMARGVGNFLFGDKNKEKASFSDTELSDPQLTAKADAATIKIYELMLKKNNVGFVGKTAKGIASLVTAPLAIAGGIANLVSPKVTSKPIVGEKEYISTKNKNNAYTPTPVNVGPKDINLNVSGTIKLDLGGKQANFDPKTLLDSPEFKAQLADIISRRLNDMGNAGKYNKEGKAVNTQSMYNRIR